MNMDTLNPVYYAHGKLLLTGEYLVLCGARAVALPLQRGQRMEVTEGRHDGLLRWRAYEQESLWFSCDLSLPGFDVVATDDPEKAAVLQATFRAAITLNPGFRPGKAPEACTRLGFHQQWGFGSSSTLIANLACWAGVDPFRLNEMIFNGSGFDIACATADGPIVYRKGHRPEPVSLGYPFLDYLYFLYTGSKRNTREEVGRFLNESPASACVIREMDQLSGEFVHAVTWAGFRELIGEHERLVSGLLRRPPVKQERFPDFEGEVKSLGAWGGDFCLAATDLDERDVRDYFGKRGITDLFPWKALVLDRRSSWGEQAQGHADPGGTSAAGEMGEMKNCKL